MLRSIIVTIEGQDARQATFIPSRKMYVETARVVRDVDLMREAIDVARRELVAWSRRHAALCKLAELSGVFEAIERAVAKPKDKTG